MERGPPVLDFDVIAFHLLKKGMDLACIIHKSGSIRGKAGMNSLSKSGLGRFVPPGLTA
jgi:hypothetical protein